MTIEQVGDDFRTTRLQIKQKIWSSRVLGHSFVVSLSTIIGEVDLLLYCNGDFCSLAAAVGLG